MKMRRKLGIGEVCMCKNFYVYFIIWFLELKYMKNGLLRDEWENGIKGKVGRDVGERWGSRWVALLKFYNNIVKEVYFMFCF